jgi:hypothetical protein
MPGPNDKNDKNKDPKKPATPAHGTAITPPPATMALADFDFGEDAGQGFENQTMADRKIPMLVILQSNSPQVLESKGIIRPGQIYNTVTKQAFDEINFNAALTDRCFLAFVSRDDGGGFRGRHPWNSKVVNDAIARNDGRALGKLPLPQANDPKTGKPQPTLELVENFEVYAVTHKDREITGFAVIPFQSTKIKVYRQWNTQLGMFMPKIGEKQFAQGEIPLYSHCVKMTTELETNAKGSYFIPVLTPANGGDDLVKSMIGPKDPRYQAAKKLHDDVRAGAAKAAYETMTQEDEIDREAASPF